MRDRAEILCFASTATVRLLVSAEETAGGGLDCFCLQLPSDPGEGLLLWRSDAVLSGLGDAELDHGLGLDLDGRAGLGLSLIHI